MTEELKNIEQDNQPAPDENENNGQLVSRRDFIKRSTGALAALKVPWYLRKRSTNKHDTDKYDKTPTVSSERRRRGESVVLESEIPQNLKDASYALSISYTAKVTGERKNVVANSTLIHKEDNYAYFIVPSVAVSLLQGYSEQEVDINAVNEIGTLSSNESIGPVRHHLENTPEELVEYGIVAVPIDDNEDIQPLGLHNIDDTTPEHQTLYIRTTADNANQNEQFQLQSKRHTNNSKAEHYPRADRRLNSKCDGSLVVTSEGRAVGVMREDAVSVSPLRNVSNVISQMTFQMSNEGR